MDALDRFLPPHYASGPWIYKDSWEWCGQGQRLRSCGDSFKSRVLLVLVDVSAREAEEARRAWGVSWGEWGAVNNGARRMHREKMSSSDSDRRLAT